MTQSAFPQIVAMLRQESRTPETKAKVLIAQLSCCFQEPGAREQVAATSNRTRRRRLLPLCPCVPSRAQGRVPAGEICIGGTYRYPRILSNYQGHFKARSVRH